MRYKGHWVIGGVAALVCGTSAGDILQSVPSTLTFRQFTDFRLVQGMMGGMTGGTDRSKQVGQGYTLPIGTSPTFFMLYTSAPGPRGDAQSPSEPYVGVLAKSDASLKAPDLMWVDWKRNKKFDDSDGFKLVSGAGIQGASVFMPAIWPTINGRTVHLALAVYGTSYVAGMPAGDMEGVVDLGGRPTKVGIVDADLNGRYGDTFGSNLGGDILLIDRNGDGKFDPPDYTSSTSTFEGDEIPLMALTWFGGKYYAVHVSPDGTTMTVKPYDGPSGTVRAAGAKPGMLVLEGPKGMLYAKPDRGRYEVPVGVYAISAFEYTVSDPKGAGWKVSVGSLPGKKLNVTPGGVATLKCGPPFSVSVTAQSMRGVHFFSVDVKDAAGVSLNGIAGPNGGRPSPPRLTIKNAQGKVVQTLDFSYG